MTLAIFFHPQIVPLTGLLVNAEWVQRARRSGHICWLSEEAAHGDILVGCSPEKSDPLVQ